MYNNYYGFTEKPFSLTPDPHFLYLSSVHRRALAYLTYGLEDRKGFITITGEIGAGKTTLIRTLIKRLDARTIVSRIVNPKVSSLQLLRMIIKDFSVDAQSDSKDELLDKLNSFLLVEYSKGRNCVVIIDEAQNLEPQSLEEIRLLSNLETEKDKLLQIILVGQPELRGVLNLPELRQLRQRITVSYHISPLTMNEVSEYICHRLSVAGAKNRDLFSQAAICKIAEASKGIPRIINIICDAALVTGYVEGVKTIEEGLVTGVLNELDLDQMQEAPPPPASSAIPGEMDQILGETQLQGLEIRELINMVAELRNKLSGSGNREERLKQKETELEGKQAEICRKLEHLIQLEQELLSREGLIKQKELDLGIHNK